MIVNVPPYLALDALFLIYATFRGEFIFLAVTFDFVLNEAW